MVRLPIVEHLHAAPSPDLRSAVKQLAEQMRAERPELDRLETFRDVACDCIDDGPALHLDDLSEISGLDGGQDIRFYQDRARLRAGDDDLVATCGDPVPGYEPYCRDYLGLGSPMWLRPQPPRLPLRIAEACWEDALVRKALINRLRNDQLAYIHPNMGTLAVWELALLLREEARRPIKVIAPPPELMRWVNDKVFFAATVSRLFGPNLVPRTESAFNLAALAKQVKNLSSRTHMLGFKLPSSAGGSGNVVMNSAGLRGRSLPEIHALLRERLGQLDWNGCSKLLVDSWETQVLCSPAAQLWIPPEPLGLPIVEGIFIQTTEGDQGIFVGTRPARLPAGLTQEITDRSWLLARLFQLLGYVGRCSFDLIVVGADLNSCRLEFIECNGRWGGASFQMTLMNRVLGDWERRPFAVYVPHGIKGVDGLEFVDLLNYFGHELFDVRTGDGTLVLSNPGRLRYQSGITATVLAERWEGAARDAQRFAGRLARLARESNAAKTIGK